MLYLLVFACGFVAGKSWEAVRTAVAPLTSDASARFDALYARTVRSLAQAAEDIEDRLVERANRDSQLMN